MDADEYHAFHHRVSLPWASQQKAQIVGDGREDAERKTEVKDLAPVAGRQVRVVIASEERPGICEACVGGSGRSWRV
jgi:hypothetical protein